MSVNFQVPFADANYTVLMTWETQSSVSPVGSAQANRAIYNRTAAGFQVEFVDGSNDLGIGDVVTLHVVAFHD